MTISEIAEKAGVSSATVSRVLNCKGHVKESTRQQILDLFGSTSIFPVRLPGA